MDELRIVEVLAAEIQKASAAGDHNRARKLAELEGRVVARISQEMFAEAIGGVAVPEQRTHAERAR